MTDRDGNAPLSATELADFREKNPLDWQAKVALAAWVNVRPDQLPSAMQAHNCPATMEAWARVAKALTSQADPVREAALRKIADMKPHHAGQTPNEYRMQQIAKAALEDAKGHTL